MLPSTAFPMAMAAYPLHKKVGNSIVNQVRKSRKGAITLSPGKPHFLHDLHRSNAAKGEGHKVH
jgi:hypothetical protein